MKLAVWMCTCLLALVACSEPPIIAPAGDAEPAPTRASSSVQAPANDLNARALAAVNQLRAGARRAPLRFSPTLGRVARLHAADMNRRGVMSHTGADGSTPAQRATAAGYNWCRIAENVAAGQPDLQSVMTGWANSPGHRRNMLDMQVTEIGVAQVGPYWAMVLGKPGC